MNILPHKSWHVRNKNNIERVRKDEAKAAEEEKERQRKIALAEQEARTDLLRKRAKQGTAGELEYPAEKVPRISEEPGSSSSEVAKSSDIYTAGGHINFFKEIEQGDVKQGHNLDHEAEKKAEKEKWEKDIGLLTYLGQSAVEKQKDGDKPWYMSGSRKKYKEPDNPDVKDQKLKNQMDPLLQMESYMEKSHKHTHKNKHREKSKSHEHKKKKHKDKDREKPKSSSSKTIEQLRAERLAREQAERQRARDMVSGQGQNQKVKDTVVEMDDRKRGYNSVYNPELVRKPKERRRYDDRYN